MTEIYACPTAMTWKSIKDTYDYCCYPSDFNNFMISNKFSLEFSQRREKERTLSTSCCEPSVTLILHHAGAGWVRKTTGHYFFWNRWKTFSKLNPAMFFFPVLKWCGCVPIYITFFGVSHALFLSIEHKLSYRMSKNSNIWNVPTSLAYYSVGFLSLYLVFLHAWLSLCARQCI